MTSLCQDKVADRSNGKWESDAAAAWIFKSNRDKSKKMSKGKKARVGEENDQASEELLR